MTAANADRCIANTLVYEGGFTLHKSDPGNWTGGKVGAGQLKGTNFGIAANTYPALDIEHLTKVQAIEIYKRDWWPKVAGDKMPKGVDQVAYDAAVNSGPARGLKFVATACGIPDERRASVIAGAATDATDKAAIVKRACAARMSFLRGLGTFVTFGTGWSRRVAAMEAIGVKMALEASGVRPVKDELKAEQKKANAAAGKEATKSAGTAGADAAAHQSIDASSFDWFANVALWAVAGAVICIAIYFAWRAIEHRHRAQAYADAAAGKIGG
jgi:lysozyme family protein